MTINPAEQKRAAAALRAAKRKSIPVELLKTAFTEQLRFITDNASRKAALTSRRSGKSTAAAIAMIIQAIEVPNSLILYTGLTSETVSSVMFNGILKKWNRKYEIGMSFKRTPTPTATFPNGSVIYGLGVDTTEDEADKILGNAYHLAVIDEAQSYTIDLKRLVESVIEPTLTDHLGSLLMIGTPGLYKNYFYEVVHSMVPGWNVHRWTALDNVYQKQQWEKKIAEMKKSDPDVETRAYFKREYMGEWNIDDNNLCYQLNLQTSFAKTLPDTKLTFIMGVDFGYRDDNGFVVVAYDDKQTYIVETYKKAELLTEEIAAKIKHFMERYDLTSIVGDSAAAQTLADLQRKYGLPIKAVEAKREKVRWIDKMSQELQIGSIKILEDSNVALIEEYSELSWDTRHYQRTRNRRENEKQPNHAADAALYAYRSILQWRGEDLDTNTATEDYDDFELKLLTRKPQETEWDSMFTPTEY